MYVSKFVGTFEGSDGGSRARCGRGRRRVSVVSVSALHATLIRWHHHKMLVLRYKSTHTHKHARAT